MDRSLPRLTSIMGVARALLATVTAEEAVEVLVAEFGWDASFQALSLLRGDDADAAFLLTWEHLAFGPVEQELRDLRWTTRSWTAGN